VVTDREKWNWLNTDFGCPRHWTTGRLHFEEWESMINQCIFVSATPADYELEMSDGVFVEQIIRPTGLNGTGS
jgi:excinuclease ABC subunit B